MSGKGQQSTSKRDRAHSSGSMIGTPTSQQTSKQQRSSKPTKYNCGDCRKAIKTTETSIECETCLSWFHINCTDLVESDVHTIAKAGVHWYCHTCDNTASGLEARMISIEKSVASIRELCTDTLQKYSTTVSESYASIVSKLQENSENINGSIMKSCETVVQKQRQLDKRKAEELDRAKNIIIFGAKECSFDETKSLIDDLLRDCDIYSKIDITSTTLHRIGKPVEEKNRPLRLRLKSEDEKWNVLKSINKARVSGIFARLDLNKEQQKQDFLLRKELREKKAANTDSDITFKIVKNKVVEVQLQH
jgi:hypothetical protein